MATAKPKNTEATKQAAKPALKATAVTKKLPSVSATKPKVTTTAKPKLASTVTAKAVKLPAARPAAKVTKAKSASPATGVRAKKPQLADEQRRHYIEIAAFYIAERRGFQPGNPLEDWLAAEEEINRLVATGRLGG